MSVKENRLQLDPRLHYDGDATALLAILVKCARRGLKLARAEDRQTIQEELDREMARQEARA